MSGKQPATMTDSGTKEMAQWLRAFVALVEALGPVPSTHMLAYTICNSSSRELQGDPLRVSTSTRHRVHIHTCRQKHSHKIKKLNLELKKNGRL